MSHRLLRLVFGAHACRPCTAACVFFLLLAAVRRLCSCASIFSHGVVQASKYIFSESTMVLRCAATFPCSVALHGVPSSPHCWQLLVVFPPNSRASSGWLGAVQCSAVLHVVDISTCKHVIPHNDRGWARQGDSRQRKTSSETRESIGRSASQSRFPLATPLNEPGVAPVATSPQRNLHLRSAVHHAHAPASDRGESGCHTEPPPPSHPPHPPHTLLLIAPAAAARPPRPATTAPRARRAAPATRPCVAAPCSAGAGG